MLPIVVTKGTYKKILDWHQLFPSKENQHLNLADATISKKIEKNRWANTLKIEGEDFFLMCGKTLAVRGKLSISDSF